MIPRCGCGRPDRPRPLRTRPVVGFCAAACWLFAGFAQAADPADIRAVVDDVLSDPRYQTELPEPATAVVTVRPEGTADAPIEVPTLYIWGREDMSVGEKAATLTPSYVNAECQFEAIDGAGHFLAEEMPERVNELLLDHLARY